MCLHVSVCCVCECKCVYCIRLLCMYTLACSGATVSIGVCVVHTRVSVCDSEGMCVCVCVRWLVAQWLKC